MKIIFRWLNIYTEVTLATSLEFRNTYIYHINEKISHSKCNFRILVAALRKLENQRK